MKREAHIILGVGEIGGAYYRLLAPQHRVFRLDKEPSRSDPAARIPRSVDVLHVCLRYGPNFKDAVLEAISTYTPRLVNIMTTCPPGTTEGIYPDACHSTTRGLHPNLDEWIRRGVKHIGGSRAAEVAEAFGSVLWEPCILHPTPRATELLHAASNMLYGAELMACDEIERLCRHYGVDYYDFMRYNETHNEGYAALGIRTKYRPILTPPHGKIGGHCVTQGAQLFPRELLGPVLRRLAEFNGPES